MGVISCLTGREDYLIWDELDHASIIEGRRLSFSNSLKFKHNDMASLEKALKSCKEDRVKLIVVDGVFSMEGDVANLPAIVELAKKYNASIYVDEAHGIGVFGRQGRGVCNHFGVTDDITIVSWELSVNRLLRLADSLLPIRLRPIICGITLVPTFSVQVLHQHRRLLFRQHSTLSEANPNVFSICGTLPITPLMVSVA